MRPVRVVACEKVVEPGLLLQHVCSGRLRRFSFQCEMHALVPPVLLWVARFDPLDLDPQSQPPHGQLAQPIEGLRGRKRAAVISPNHLREPKLLERALEDREGKCLLGGQQRLARQQVRHAPSWWGQSVTHPLGIRCYLTLRKDTENSSRTKRLPAPPRRNVRLLSALAAHGFSHW